MPYKGQIISNSKTGEYIEFIETAKETHGVYTKIKILQKKGGFKPVLHQHSNFCETFEVLNGELTYILKGEKGTIRAGEKIVLPEGEHHTHYNEGNDDLLMYQTFTPSLDADLFLENLFGLVEDGKVPKGQPAFLQLMVWGKTFKSKTYIASVPTGLQKVLTNLLAPVGRLIGYKAVYEKYSGYNA